MSPPPFHNFDTAHLTIIAVTFVIPLALAGLTRWTRTEALLRAIAWILAAGLVANYAAYLIYKEATVGLSLAHGLPMQLCDWALVATTIALLTRRLRWFELAYFWGLGGTLQAIITPNLRCGFPSFACLNFFAIHSGIVMGVLFMIFAMNLRPRPASLPRTLLWSEVFLVTALVVNALTGANYGFLSRKPDGHSLLDFLSNSPVLYVLEMNAVALLFFAVLYLPFLAIDSARALRDRIPATS